MEIFELLEDFHKTGASGMVTLWIVSRRLTGSFSLDKYLVSGTSSVVVIVAVVGKCDCIL